MESTKFHATTHRVVAVFDPIAAEAIDANQRAQLMQTVSRDLKAMQDAFEGIPCKHRRLMNSRAECGETKLPVTVAQCANCSLESQRALTVLGLGKEYLSAVARWVAAGRPVRDADEIARIMDAHCLKCEKRDGTTCTQCGCSVNKSKFPLGNKLAMGTERCPLGQW